MRRMWIYILILLIIILISFTVNAEEYGGKLQVKMNKMALTLNPIHSFNRTEKTINKQIFDSLVVINSQGEISNNLTESWEINDDSTIFTFNLKEDVYFHPYQINGKELSLEERKVTAADWKWSFEYLADPINKSPYAEIFKNVIGYDEYRQQKTNEIKGIKAVNEYQLEIKLKKSDAPFINNLIKKAAVVMPKEAVLNSNNKFSLKPVGTGAFKLKSFSNNNISLSKNEHYWKKGKNKSQLPYLDEIEYHFDNSKNLDDDYKEFDLYELNREQLVEYYHNRNTIDSQYSFEKIPDNNIYFVAINYNSDLNNGLNFEETKEKTRSTLEKNNFINNYNLNNFSYLENNSFTLLNKIDANNEKIASKEIKAAENTKLSIVINNSELSFKAAEFIKNSLKSSNIDLKIEEYRWTDYLNILENNLDSNLFIMSYNYENKFDFIADNFYSESQKNYFNYENRRVDTLIDYIRLTKDKNNQSRAYKIIEEILVNDNPYIILFQAADNYLINNQLVNKELFKNIYMRDNFELIYLK